MSETPTSLQPEKIQAPKPVLVEANETTQVFTVDKGGRPVMKNYDPEFVDRDHIRYGVEKINQKLGIGARILAARVEFIERQYNTVNQGKY